MTAEATASDVVSISALAPAFQEGQCLTGSVHFDKGGFPVLMTVDLTHEWNCFVELIHPTRDDRESDPMVIDRIQLTRTAPTYGGRRWWFLCPKTGYRATKLFLPNGRQHFWSRRGYDFGYACQREDRFSRLQRRAARLNRQLGGEGLETWDMPPPKPKWMRWPTYEGKYERWERAVERANAEFTVCTMWILRRPIR